jgi:hypothetical protein
MYISEYITHPTRNYFVPSSIKFIPRNRSTHEPHPINKIEYGNEFRRIQETVRKDSQEVGKSVSGKNIPKNRRQDLANVLRRELGSQYSFAHGSSRNVVS